MAQTFKILLNITKAVKEGVSQASTSIHGAGSLSGALKVEHVILKR